MALVMNASAETQKFKVYGNHFELKPGQIKSFQDHMARFIAMERKYLGLIVLPDELEDLDYRQSPEGINVLEEKRAEGVKYRIAHLKETIHNNTVSLRSDLEKANLKADPKAYASDGEFSAYEELVKYQTKQEDEVGKRVEKLKELEKKLAKGGV